MEEVFGAEDDPVVDSMPSGKKAQLQKEKSSNGKKRKVIFQYGNYNRYYGYRVGSTLEADPRMSLMQKTWFENKDVIDVGCNEGHVTISLVLTSLRSCCDRVIFQCETHRKLMDAFATVQKYRVRSMCGIDIDPGLIHKAWKNLELEAGLTGGKTVNSLYEWADYIYEDEMDCDDYYDDDEKPARTDSSVGAITTDETEGGLQGKELLERVIFKNANILHCNLRRNVVDTVLCLSVVKWIHLNWGDEGLLDFFIKTYRALRPGGAFILEPQPWSSYERKRRVSEVCRKNFRTMILRPDHFPGILLEQIGFKSCKEISLEVPNSTKGFSRPLYLFTK